jgi:hypothetical protein
MVAAADYDIFHDAGALILICAQARGHFEAADDVTVAVPIVVDVPQAAPQPTSRKPPGIISWRTG